MKDENFVKRWGSVEQPKTLSKITGALSEKSLQTLLNKHCPGAAHHPDLVAFVGAANSIGVPEKDCLAFLLANQDRVSDQSSYYDNAPQMERLVDSVYSLYRGQHAEHKKEPPAGPRPKQEQTPEERDYTQILKEAAVDVVEDLPPPPVCLSFLQGNLQVTIGTLGNFSMIIGKAKSRKTFFVGIMLASWIRNGTVLDKVLGSLPDGRRTVLHFDTEQGRYHVLKTARTALRLAGNNAPDHYRPYGLRRFAPDVRLGVIEHAIYEDATVGAVVIDGIRDLASLGINNEEEATTLTTKLLQWTEDRQIHIVVILHQNKNDANARGHLGTELVNKAETVLSVTKDDKNRDLSLVEAEFCRDIDPEPFAFQIGPDGLPELLQDLAPAKSRPVSKAYRPADQADEFHLGKLRLVFSQKGMFPYGDLCRAIKEAYGRGDTATKTLIVPYVQERGWVRQSEKSYYLACPS